MPEPLVLLEELAGQEDCRYDHHGGCQTHGFLELAGNMCPHAEARELIADPTRSRRILGEEQCCPLGCNGGACESCPCCSAGACVWGTDFAVDGLPDTENWLTWIDVAAAHNPVANVLHKVLWAVGLGPEDA